MRKKNSARIAILGAGSWGSAVAIHLAKAGNTVILWGRDSAFLTQAKGTRENTRYLPGIPFPQNLQIETDFDAACAKADDIIIAVPSHAFEALLPRLPSSLSGLSWLTKGLNPRNHALLSASVLQHFGPTFPIGIIAGPSFAKEVARGLPTALTIASNATDYLQHIHNLFHVGNIRAYTSQDIIGVQLCGAVKNVLAIACGISDGLQYGANAKAALITRGLQEMSRLGLQQGGNKETVMGLAGVGDLVLTCTDNQSRNRRFGLLLGQGKTIAAALAEIGQVVEGKDNAFQVCRLASTFNIDMPICQEVHALIEGKTTVHEAVANLMRRPAKND